MSDKEIDAKVNTDEEDVRILTFDDFEFPDLDNEIDLSDIFDDEEAAGIHDDEVLKIFRRGNEEGRKNTGVSDKTMVASRAEIKEEVLEQESIERQRERARREEEELRGELSDVDRKKKRHRRSYFFLKLLLLLIALGAVTAFALSPFFTIKHIKVEGNYFYTDEQIINMSEAKAEGNLFLNAQKSLIKDNLKQDIYFRSVSVRRSIPDTLVIVVDEKRELAALTYGDRFIVIDEEGEVLRFAKIDPEVTVLNGFTIREMDIGEKISVEEQKTMKETMSTLHAMQDGDLFFKKIDVSQDEVTAYIYDMLRVRGTSAQLEAAISDGTLRKVVNKLMKTKIKRGTIILGDNGYISFSPAVQ